MTDEELIKELRERPYRMGSESNDEAKLRRQEEREAAARRILAALTPQPAPTLADEQMVQDAYDALADQRMDQPTPTLEDALADGRPCATDVFLKVLFDAVDDHHDRSYAINEWLHGDWQAATEGLALAALSVGHREASRVYKSGAIERGYAQYRPDHWAWAWKGECDK
jgi:hypothetical protein